MIELFFLDDMYPCFWKIEWGLEIILFIEFCCSGKQRESSELLQ